MITASKCREYVKAYDKLMKACGGRYQSFCVRNTIKDIEKEIKKSAKNGNSKIVVDNPVSYMLGSEGYDLVCSNIKEYFTSNGFKVLEEEDQWKVCW